MSNFFNIFLIIIISSTFSFLMSKRKLVLLSKNWFIWHQWLLSNMAAFGLHVTVDSVVLKKIGKIWNCQNKHFLIYFSIWSNPKWAWGMRNKKVLDFFSESKLYFFRILEYCVLLSVVSFNELSDFSNFWCHVQLQLQTWKKIHNYKTFLYYVVYKKIH